MHWYVSTCWLTTPDNWQKHLYIWVEMAAMSYEGQNWSIFLQPQAITSTMKPTVFWDQVQACSKAWDSNIKIHHVNDDPVWRYKMTDERTHSVNSSSWNCCLSKSSQKKLQGITVLWAPFSESRGLLVLTFHDPYHLASLLKPSHNSTSYSSSQRWRVAPPELVGTSSLFKLRSLSYGPEVGRNPTTRSVLSWKIWMLSYVGSYSNSLWWSGRMDELLKSAPHEVGDLPWNCDPFLVIGDLGFLTTAYSSSLII